jgi:hypothetical protein
MVFSHLMYLVYFLREIRHLLALYANCGKPETNEIPEFEDISRKWRKGHLLDPRECRCMNSRILFLDTIDRVQSDAKLGQQKKQLF